MPRGGRFDSQWRGLGFLSCAETATSLFAGFVRLFGSSHLSQPPFLLAFFSFLRKLLFKRFFFPRFFRVSILVNTSGVRVNLFLVEIKRRLLKDLVLKKPDLSRLCSSHYNNLRLHFCYSYFKKKMLLLIEEFNFECRATIIV